MKLEEQIEKLSEIGLFLNDGVSIDDLLLSYSREEYESAPFDLILFVYGIEIEEEPWGRFICDQTWNFDIEAIEDNGSYVEIVKQFHRISGKSKRIEGLKDSIDIEGSRALLQYEIDGVKRELKPVVDNDWADAEIIEKIMNDLRQPGYNFYPKDNGQASIWFYLSEQQALALNKLANNVFNLNRKPWWKVW
nr:hypothetical protein [uncultured Pseudomonas sp.]